MPEGGKVERTDASGSVEVDSFLREVARAPRLHPSHEAPAEPDLVGRTLLHFHVVERLGAGGMGVVYKAIDEKLRRPVALKALSARLLTDARHRETLVREARSAAAVNHPNIASIYEVHDGPDVTFFVMELVDGETLRARLARTGAFTVAEALRVAHEIAQGLARAHASNIVHRDLKCENVMLARDGHVKLLDFGLATVQGVDEGPVTSDVSSGGDAAAMAPTMPATPTPTTGGRVAGTPASMAPEQARGEVIDARADVYGFGVVLYEMLSGQVTFAHRGGRPWDWGDATSPAWKPQRPLRQVAPKAPREVQDLVARCLSYAKEGRPADGAALVAEIEARRATQPRRASLVAAIALAALSVALVVGWAGSRPRAAAQSSPPAGTITAPAPAARPTIKRLVFDEGLGAASQSADGQRVVYSPLLPTQLAKTVRVRDLATQRDDWIQSPDGKNVETAVFRGEGAAERLIVATNPGAALWSVHPVTKAAVLLAASGASEPFRTSADGRFVMWRRTDDDPKASRMTIKDLQTEHVVEVPVPIGSSADLSPDGSRLAWDELIAGNRLLRVVRTDAPRDVKTIVPEPHLDVFQAVWIDEERVVLLSRDVGNARSSLWTLRLDPTTLEVRGKPELLVDWSGFVVWDLRIHGARHAISVLGNDGHYELMVGQLKAGTRQLEDVARLVRSSSSNYPAAWTADGDKVLFVSDRSGRWGIYEKGLTESSPERPVAVGTTRHDWPQIAPGGDAVLYWDTPVKGTHSLMRAAFDGTTAAPATPLFDAPDLEDPISANMGLRCPAGAQTCILLWATSESSRGWYRLDPGSGARTRIDGLPLPGVDVGHFWDVSPDGREIAYARKSIDVFRIDGPTKLIRSLPLGVDGLGFDLVVALAYDPGNEGLFVAWVDGYVDYVTKDDHWTRIHEGGANADVIQNLLVSPDGTHLAFATMSTSVGLWSVEPAFDDAAPGAN